MTASLEDREFVARVRAAFEGRFTDLDRVGEGGMAVVFRAVDEESDRLVAVKVFRPELATGSGEDRFRQEGEISSDFRHPNVVPVLESGVAGGLLYIVMPFIEGETLAERLRREGPLPIDHVLGIAREIGEGLQAAHDAGYLHRDIKPENIILGADGAVLTDFGIAKALDEASERHFTRSGVSVGTPRYMSPEQGAGEKRLDVRSDQYSLACVLYEALAGEPPFTGPTSVIVIARHVADDPPSLAIARPAAPSPMVRAIHRALSKTPADRFGSVRGFVVALEQRGRPEALRPRWPLVAGGVLVAAALVGLFMARWGSAPLDPNHVLIFPPDAPGYETDVGEVVANYIGYVLEGTDPLVWKEARDWMASAATADLSLADKARLAREAGARYSIDGSIIREPDSVRVILRLVDAETVEVVERAGQASSRVGASETRLASQAITHLLGAIIAPGRIVDLGALWDPSPVAVARFYLGDEEYRRSRFAEALAHYGAASEADEVWPLPDVKAAQAAHWLEDLPTAAAYADSALARDSLLPARYARMALAVSHRVAGRTDSALAEFRTLHEQYPDWEEAAAGVGEVLYHRYPSVPDRDSLARAAFEASVAADSTFTPPLYHLAEMALRAGDVARARGLVGRLERVDPDAEISGQLRIMMRCAAEGPGAMDWPALAADDHASLLAAAYAMASAPRLRPCALAAAEAAFQAESSVRWGSYLLYHALLVAEQRTDQVRAILDSERAAGLPVHSMLLIDAVADPGLQELADSVYRARQLDSNEPSSPTAWLLLGWATHRARTDDAASLADLLVVRDDPDDRQANLFARIGRAYAALAAGDSVDAVRRLGALEPDGPEQGLVWNPWESLVLERLLQARLLIESGRADEAREVLAEMGSHRALMETWLAPERDRLTEAARPPTP